VNIREITEAEKCKKIEEKGRGLLQTIQDPDRCCNARFYRDAQQGLIDNAVTWTCPKCGQEYRPQMIGLIRTWVAHVWAQVIR
jgi:hypothetical protein